MTSHDFLVLKLTYIFNTGHQEHEWLQKWQNSSKCVVSLYIYDIIHVWANTPNVELHFTPTARSNLHTEGHYLVVSKYQIAHSPWHIVRGKGQPFCFYWPGMINLCMGDTEIITCMIYAERKKVRKGRTAEELCFSPSWHKLSGYNLLKNFKKYIWKDKERKCILYITLKCFGSISQMGPFHK